MRTLAILAALGLAGCWYDRPNPWDTSADVEAYEEKIHDDLRLAMLEVWPNPRAAPDPLQDPEIDAWSRTVLATAERSTLAHAEEKSRQKIAFLEGQIRSLMRTDEHSRKEVLTPILWNWRTEKIRLKLIGERLGSARG
jgi:hypothetical protein